MEIGAQAIALERHSRAATFDDFAAESNEQRLDPPPLQRSRDRLGEQGFQGLAVLGVHGKMIANYAIFGKLVRASERLYENQAINCRSKLAIEYQQSRVSPLLHISHLFIGIYFSYSF